MGWGKLDPGEACTQPCAPALPSEGAEGISGTDYSLAGQILAEHLPYASSARSRRRAGGGMEPPGKGWNQARDE